MNSLTRLRVQRIAFAALALVILPLATLAAMSVNVFFTLALITIAIGIYAIRWENELVFLHESLELAPTTDERQLLTALNSKVTNKKWTESEGAGMVNWRYKKYASDGPTISAIVATEAGNRHLEVWVSDTTSKHGTVVHGDQAIAMREKIIELADSLNHSVHAPALDDAVSIHEFSV